MTGGLSIDHEVSRFRQLRADADGLAAAMILARQSATERLASEAELARHVAERKSLSGIGPRTWGTRASGRMAQRRQQAEDAVRASTSRHQRAVADNKIAVAALAKAQAASDSLPEARERAVGALTGPDGDRLRESLRAADRLADAIATTHRVFLASTGVEDTLDSAGRWSTYDLWLGGGFMASALKHDAIYTANDKAGDLTSLVNELRADLQHLDVPTAYFSVQMNDAAGSDTSDAILDSLLSDILIHRRIGEAARRVDGLQEGLHRLGSTLGQARQRILEEIDRKLMAMGTA